MRHLATRRKGSHPKCVCSHLHGCRSDHEERSQDRRGMEGTARGSRPLGMVLRTVGVWRRCCSQRCWPPDDTGWKDGRNRSRFPSSSSNAFRQEEDSIYPDTQMLLMIRIISVKGRKEPHSIRFLSWLWPSGRRSLPFRLRFGRSAARWFEEF